MITERVSLNGKVGFLVFLLGTAGYIWTFYMRLRTLELIVPRVALVLIAVGGALILIKDLLEKGPKEEPSRENVLPYIAGVLAVMWLYGWFFRNIGIVVSSFIFLSIWWIWLTIRDAKRTNSLETIKPKLIRLIAFALGITAAIYLLFIVLLGMYLPRTLLF